jgi:2-polyprenyl-3-methyl-5-hydroxy-6-metoxy-1,4-benzoquinol methylase
LSSFINNSSDTQYCPLCDSLQCHSYHRDQTRAYLQCTHCSLVFVPRQYHLTATRERAEYDKHQNTIDDPGYRRFLARLTTPLIARLPTTACGLDFGCGPGPALAMMLTNAGYSMSLYDIYYQPHREVLQRQYDFITATEVIEHLSQPGRELRRLWQLLHHGGQLALMTKLVIDRERFATWHYIRDPTHIAFFSQNSLGWLAAQLGAELELIGQDVAILTKPSQQLS